MAANDLLVARRYARAILELGLEGNNVDQWRADLATLRAIWVESSLAARLDDVTLGRARRAEQARSLVQGRVGPLALNLVLLLVQRGRSGLIPRIATALEQLERVREGRVTAQVTSAIALTEAQKANLRVQLGRRTDRTVDLEEHVDPSILGGLIVRIGDELIDGSVVERLRRIEAQLLGR